MINGLMDSWRAALSTPLLGDYSKICEYVFVASSFFMNVSGNLLSHWTEMPHEIGEMSRTHNLPENILRNVRIFHFTTGPDLQNDYTQNVQTPLKSKQPVLNSLNQDILLLLCMGAYKEASYAPIDVTPNLIFSPWRKKEFLYFFPKKKFAKAENSLSVTKQLWLKSRLLLPLFPPLPLPNFFSELFCMHFPQNSSKPFYFLN